MQVPILKQGAYLIATVQSALTDEDLKQLRDTLVLSVSRVRARGVIVDVTALDVIDSFATRTLRDVAHMIRLRGRRPSSWGSNLRWPSRWSSWGSRWRGSQPRWTWKRASRTLTARGRVRAMRFALIADEVRVSIDCDADIVSARQKGRDLASQCGLPTTDLAVVATAISELARNILRYAVHGEIILRLVEDHGKRGVEVLATDDGPGIPDLTLAMQDGYSTSGGLGLGLPGTRRLMDEFEIISEFGKGTTVTVRRWKR